MTDAARVDDEWLKLGLGDAHLTIARAVFETPADVRPWVSVLARFGPTPDRLREAILAGLDPDEFMAWRSAGVPSQNIGQWPKLLSQAGLTPDHVNRWRSARHKPSTLPRIVGYLSDDVTFDEVLELIENWNAEGLIGVVESGVDISDVVEMRRAGVRGQTLVDWSSSEVPASAWSDWMGADVSPDVAVRFHARGLDANTAQEWLGTGLSVTEAVELLDSDVDIVTVHEWVDSGFPPADTATSLGADLSLTEAHAWTSSNIPIRAAVVFVRAGVALDTAAAWLGQTDMDADEIVDFIQKGVSLDQAVDFEGRGIGSHQVQRTDAGLKLDLDPWQEDPADQLPNTVEAGAVNLTLWMDAWGGDPKAYDIDFIWDGDRTVEWYEDISLVNDLSPMSSSPTSGVLAWPDGENVVVTYTWSDLGLEGHDRLTGIAPTNGGAASDPAQWVRLGFAILRFVLNDLGDRYDEDTTEYLDTVGDCLVDIHDVFKVYLGTDAASTGDFGRWLEGQVAAGRFEELEDES
ncbi:hypothetical protein ACIGKQ_24725 [Gordonia sp. NPDC062954]|uniref:hypothetical protein n=1 Tax=Gordonia sp. NPDC062954 TaxID=3364003 RepID=UPI0037CBDF38